MRTMTKFDALTRWAVLAVTLSFCLCSLADPPSTQTLRYMMVFKANTAERDEPDMASLGGHAEKRWKNRRVVQIPLAALDALKKHPSIAFLA